MRAAKALLLLFLAGCTQFPALDATIPPESQAADFPALVPLKPLLDATKPTNGTPAEISQDLQDRIAALRARTRNLQSRSIVDGPTRARLQSALN